MDFKKLSTTQLEQLIAQGKNNASKESEGAYKELYLRCFNKLQERKISQLRDYVSAHSGAATRSKGYRPLSITGQVILRVSQDILDGKLISM